MVLFLNPPVFSLVLTLVLQKRCRVDYGFDEDELEKMLAELEGGSNSAIWYRSRRATSSVVSESLDPQSRLTPPNKWSLWPLPLTFNYLILLPWSNYYWSLHPWKATSRRSLRLGNLLWLSLTRSHHLVRLIRREGHLCGDYSPKVHIFSHIFIFIFYKALIFNYFIV